MASKKNQKLQGKKNGQEQGNPPSSIVLSGGATPGPSTTPADGTTEIVVFAFRLTRAERDEIHAATGSAKASRFIRTIALAGARGDMKAVQEAMDEVRGPGK